MSGEKAGDKTVLGPTLEIEGEIEGDEDLVIQGKIQGKIISKKDLTVDNSGKVEASITTKNLAVSGMLVGNVTASERVMRKLAMNWGVTGVLVDNDAGADDDAVIESALRRGRELGIVVSGDVCVVTAGRSRETGSTNLIRVVTVP